MRAFCFPPAQHDHGPRGYWAFDAAVRAQVRPARCVLDGELVVWNKEEQAAVPFGARVRARLLFPSPPPPHHPRSLSLVALHRT